jgi:hypothetical protein
MPDKQERYRNRQTDQGLKRVEVLVPIKMAAHLKAYARALRDAHQLCVDPPLFEGMARVAAIQILPQEAVPTTKTNARDIESDTTTQNNTNRPNFSKGIFND